VLEALAEENVPTSQSSHAPGPVMALYVPAIHLVHSPPSGPVVPMSHLQSVCAELNGSDTESDGHVEHGDDPFTSLYFPASQAVHSKPS